MSEEQKEPETAVAADTTPNNSQQDKGSEATKKRRSSLFTRARMSWVNSGGQRGASVEALRGTHGAEFEGYATVKRGSDRPLCGCFDKSDKKVLVMIKGSYIFVYKNEQSQAPMYAVSLAHLKAHRREEVMGYTTVDLETNLGDIEYEFTFHTANKPDEAKTFARVVAKQAQKEETEEVQRRLGHPSSSKPKSVLYAENIAKDKVKDQPEKPISAEEIMANMPMETY
jgi:hypothetical protein